MITLDQLIDTAMRLPYDQRQTLIGILLKRQTWDRREEISRNAEEAIRDFHAGKLKTETFSPDAIAGLLNPADAACKFIPLFSIYRRRYASHPNRTD